MNLGLTTTCRVPSSLESVTRIGDEDDPRAAGVKRDDVAAIWTAAERLYKSGTHPAIQVCVRRRGHVILNRAIGHASGNGPDDPAQAKKIQATPATPFNLYSASKAVTAMVVHLLDQDRLLHLDDPVCEYIPEFGVHHKQWITIRHVLSHRAGIPNLPPEAINLEILSRPDEIVGMLCEAKPLWRPGRQLAYHAITGGFILGEVVRRVTGKTVRAVLDQRIRRPLGFRWFNYGVPARDVGKVAVNYFTGPPPMPPLSTILHRALGVGFREATTLSNDPRFLTAVIPAGTVIATANELSRFFQLLLDGGTLDGVRIFSPRTIGHAITEQSYFEFDLTLGLPLRYGLGFMLGGKWLSLYGPDTQYAYGHLGFTNIVGWADPEREVAAAILTSGKPLIYPALFHAYNIAWQIGRACPKSRPHGAAENGSPPTRRRARAKVSTSRTGKPT